MRFEYKYIVPNFRAGELRKMLMPFLQPDPFASKLPGYQYTVRSIYFDTPYLEMYHTKQDHLAHRMKVRLRSYNIEYPDADTFFEIKRKYEGPIVKNRATVSFQLAKSFFSGRPIDAALIGVKNADNIRRFFYQVHSKHLKPIVNVIYDREAYVSRVMEPSNDFRLTFDKNLRSVPLPKSGRTFCRT